MENTKQEGMDMTKLYMIKKGNSKFYACKYNCGMYTIDKITKSVGYTVKCFESLESLEKWAGENGYKKVA